MLLKPTLHRKIYFYALVILAIGLPISKVLMSIAQMILLGNWLLEGGFKSKIRNLFSTRAALIILIFYLFHFVGFIYTENFSYALDDVRIKLPFLILPLVIGSAEPLTKSDFYKLMLYFCAGVLISTLVSFGVYICIVPYEWSDVRDITLFVSHIRLSLFICLSVFSLYYFSKKNATQSERIFFYLTIIWFTFFLYIIESVTGFAILFITGYMLLLLKLLSRKYSPRKNIYATILTVLPIVFVVVAFSLINQYFFIKPVDIAQLEYKSAGGEKYSHDIKNEQTENGNHVWINVAPVELETEWNKRSIMPYSGKDNKGQPLYSTLIRFLASKGYKKDAWGISMLTDKEIKAIENGIANVNYIDGTNMFWRVHEVMWEISNYVNNANHQGNSVTQRIEFWRASLNVVKQNLFLGVGIGDVKDELSKSYSEINTPLSEHYRLKPHNQYLTTGIALGVLGILLLLATTFFAPVLSSRINDYFYFVFMVIASLSMLTEDTLETQAGATFFVLFFCLFLFGKENKDKA
jgi:hypothetical protein